MSADITPDEHIADCLSTARACLDQLPADTDPAEAERWLQAGVNWAARALSWTERIPDPLRRAEQETEARAVVVRAALRLAHAEAARTRRCCCPEVEALHRRFAPDIQGDEDWSGADVARVLYAWFEERSLPVPV